MNKDKQLTTAISIIDRWVKSIDTINHIIDDGTPEIKAAFDDRTCTDTYRSMQQGQLFLEAKIFLYEQNNNNKSI